MANTLVAPYCGWYDGGVRHWGYVLIVWAAIGACSVASADTIKTTPPPAAGANDGAAPRSRTPTPRDNLPIDDPSWGLLEPGQADRPADGAPDGSAPSGSSRLLPLLALCGAVLVGGLLLARSLRHWRPTEVAKYLERTGAPWGRREDLFVEKLVLELRILRTEELGRRLALEKRFEELDKVERPLRKMRSQFRSVRREYRHIATRIGPVSEDARNTCAQAIRRSGLVQATTLSPQETEAMRRLSVAIEREKNTVNAAS